MILKDNFGDYISKTHPDPQKFGEAHINGKSVQSIGQIESNDMHMISTRYDLTSLGSLQGHPATFWISVY